MPLPPFAFRSPTADTTMTLVFPVIDVLTVQGVPPVTVRLTGIHSARSESSQNVRPGGDRLQMPWIYTEGVAAQVIEMEPVRNRTNEPLVGETMDKPILAVESERTISLRSSTGLPLPARIRVQSRNTRPENLSLPRWVIRRNMKRIAVVVPRPIVAGTPSPSEQMTAASLHRTLHDLFRRDHQVVSFWAAWRLRCQVAWE